MESRRPSIGLYFYTDAICMPDTSIVRNGIFEILSGVARP